MDTQRLNKVGVVDLRARSVEEFIQHQPASSTVLIVEPNPYHGEILPGFVNLFQRAGFGVELLIRQEVVAENPFTRYPANRLPSVFCGSDEEMKHALQSDVVKHYHTIFFSTNVIWEGDKHHEPYLQYLGFEPQGQHPSLFVEHNLLLLDDDEARPYYDDGRLFTLLPYPLEGGATRFLNPHFFGNATAMQPLADPTKILVLGSSSRDPKNLERLYSAVRQALGGGGKFTVSVVGGALDIPADLRQTIQVLDRMNFTDYYRVVDEHDYLLTLIDLDSIDIIHRKYSHGTTSGTIQISLGFGKPMIIDQRHADAYGFDDTTAVVYQGDDVLEGLRRAVHAEPAEYAKRVKQLGNKSRELDKQSVQQIRQTLGRPGLLSRLRRAFN